MSVTIGIDIGAASALAVAIVDGGRIVGRGEQAFGAGAPPAPLPA